ncbi:hypothetical protein ABZ922_32060 [Streptomyces shenzhenensis]|uniref:hypothetical protein n=1 Tax=Streptomyces shenzhenensis TaxID=943815 RepID=UPI0033E68390
MTLHGPFLTPRCNPQRPGPMPYHRHRAWPAARLTWTDGPADAGYAVEVLETVASGPFAFAECRVGARAVWAVHR